MTNLKEKADELKSKMQSATTKSQFVSKVVEAAKKHQLMDEMPFWQANNDKSPTNKPWGKEN